MADRNAQQEHEGGKSPERFRVIAGIISGLPQGNSGQLISNAQAKYWDHAHFASAKISANAPPEIRYTAQQTADRELYGVPIEYAKIRFNRHAKTRRELGVDPRLVCTG